MTITEKQRHDIKKFVKELERFKGRHTELVTVYIPQEYDIIKIINHLQQEQGTASNIKSSSTRKNVTDALERMIQHLRLIPKTPPNGLAVFSGNVAEREGQSDVKVWSIEPPVPLKIRLYRCDKEFVLEPLVDMCQIKEMYALVVMDRRDGTIGLLKGKTIIPILKTHSEVPGKFRAGGQSSQRFERLIDGAAKEHFKKLAEHMKDKLLGYGNDLKGIIIGGPGPTKYEFAEGNFITTELKKRILGIKDITYTDETGLEELLERSEDILANEEVAEEKKVVNKFLETLGKNPDLVAYGYDHTKKMLDMGVVGTLLLSDTLDEAVLEELDAIARKYSTEVVIVSDQTREGVQLKNIGGIAAMLRYAIPNN